MSTATAATGTATAAADDSHDREASRNNERDTSYQGTSIRTCIQTRPLRAGAAKIVERYVNKNNNNNNNEKEERKEKEVSRVVLC